jgi:acetolactate synthase-1/2/3 large subunit
MAELQKMLAAAERPIAIVGGVGWTDRACAAFQRFAERFDLPVAASFRRASLFDGDHPNYCGEIGIGPNPKLKERIASADLVLLVGGRMSEMPSQSYTLFGIPAPRQTLVHVYPDPNEIGRIYNPTLGIVATADAFCAAIEGLQPPNAIAWSDQSREARADYLDWSDKVPAMPGRVDLGALMLWLRERLPHGAIIANGAGNYATWPGRFLRYGAHVQQLGPTSGSMGFGVPAAVGAKRTRPDRMVVSFSGDGCFLMNGQEFATAVQYDLPIVFVVVDNAMYGTIRMHQEREYPGRISATELKNPDFAAYARAFGGHGETVEATAEFAPAFERAVASGKPAILHVKIDPDAISPTTTLSAIRRRALTAREG